MSRLVGDWSRGYLERAVCRFPKHRGQTWLWVCEHDTDYARWILETIEDLDEELQEALAWGVAHLGD